MRSAYSRRHFLKTAGAITMAFSGLNLLDANGLLANTATPGGRELPGFGALIADPAGIMDLPQGFSYKVISKIGNKMSDGLLVPGLPDGMAAFPAPGGKTVIVRNHELNVGDFKRGPFGETNEIMNKELVASRFYDAGQATGPCTGGTTNIVFDTKTQQLESEFLSLGGTVRNCAGGPTPWGTWLTCEETTVLPGDVCAKEHGYVFDVPGTTDCGLVEGVAIKAMGRFSHEAVAVDPATGIVYQTEDTHDSLIYRYIPNTPGELLKGGRLQALAVREQKSLDTRNWSADGVGHVAVGTVLETEWIDIEDVESPNDDLRLQGFAKGAARFARGEGMWWGNDAVYIAATSGGRRKKGQIWKYTPSPKEGTPEEAAAPGRLELFVEPNDASLLDNCDNLTVAPWGDLIVCEDGPGENFLVGITPKGNFYRVGRNAISDGELAGVCFSPDGSTLFVNLQGAGLTVAITGPWRG